MRGLRAAWPEQVAGVRPGDFVFLDESGVNRAMTRLYARRPRGTRAFGSAPRTRGENVSILGALTWPGTLEPMVISGATDGAVFLTCRREVLAPQLRAGAVVVMDHLGAHRVRGVRELIEAAGARRLYLPPYSPELNPIEMAWSKLKTHLRRVAARSTQALDAAIGQGRRAVSAQDARGFFKHCGYPGLLN